MICIVSLGDGSTSDAMGVGTVKIKMFDRMIRILSGVAYALKMQRNLISLSQLDSMGYRYSVVDGAMKVTHSCLVLMKGENMMLCIIL